MKQDTFILTAIIILMGISLVQAEQQTLGIFKAGESISLVQNCLTSSYSNISRITYPNGSFALNTQTAMVKNGDDYSYAFSDTNALGQYSVYGTCDESGVKTNWVYDFQVTATGEDLTSAKATAYVIIFIISFIVFLALLTMGIYLPVRNKSDEMTGYILAVSNLKYLKLFCLGLSYIVIVFISYFAWMFSYAYLDMDFVTTIFQFIFYALAALVLPLFILFTYFTIANLIRDSQIGEQLSRGLRVR